MRDQVDGDAAGASVASNASHVRHEAATSTTLEGISSLSVGVHTLTNNHGEGEIQTH